MKTASAVSLDKTANHTTCRFHKINHHPELNHQLASRGFVPGAIIKVLRSGGRGPLLIEIKHTRMAIGRLEASKIMVVPMAEE